MTDNGITRVTIDVSATLRACFGETIEITKDLQPHERVCTACRGLGAIKRDMPFAMRGPGEAGHGFPYHQEYVGPCPNCYNGIEKLCEFCAEPLYKGYTSGAYWCNCKEASDERSRTAKDKEAARMAKAKRVPLAEYTGTMLFRARDEVFVEAEDAREDARDDPEELYYACDPVDNWVKPAAAELIDDLDNRAADEWEDFEGLDLTDEAKDALQNALDLWWTEHVKLQTLYYPNEDTIVVVPAESEPEE